MGFKGPKPQGPSKAELDAQKQEKARLEAERKQQELQADRDRQLRIAGQQAARRRATGRGSLIATSELGVKSKLGG